MESINWRLVMKKHIVLALALVLFASMAGCYFFPERDNVNDPYNGTPVFLNAYKISNGTRPSIAWTGTEYGMVWHTSYFLYFARISKDGVKIGSDLQIGNGGVDYITNPAIVWNGSEFGVAWAQGPLGQSEIFFTRVSSAGAEIGSDIPVTTDDDIESASPSIVWTGTKYGLAWHDKRLGGENFEIYFALLDAAGSKEGTDVPISNDSSGSLSPSLAWNNVNSEYGVAWADTRNGMDNEEIYFARISSAGAKLGTDVRITNSTGASSFASLIWAEGTYALAWVDDRDDNEEIYFTRIDPDGIEIGNDVRITKNSDINTGPKLVWAGSCYAVVEMDYEFYYNVQAFLLRFDESGKRIGINICLSDKVQEAFHPVLLWTGSRYAAAWKYGEGAEEIYFRVSE
jgi:hypothetical protein